MDLTLLITLIAGHFLADFGLQTDFMAQKKRKAFVESIGFYVLTAHASIHGLVAGLITQNVFAGLIVASSHWLIDFVRSADVVTRRSSSGKNASTPRDSFGINIDQLLHIMVLVAVAINLQ